MALTDNNTPMRPQRRTMTAIALAIAAGVPVGLLLSACAVPFGPVLVGWFVALVGGVIVSAALCVLATSRYFLVGLGYAAGVAGTVVIMTVVESLATTGNVTNWWLLPAQFALVLVIVGCASSLGSSICALLKWEDQRARAKEQ